MTGQEKIVKAIYGAPDRPLKIGNVEISCYVLEDERRVLVRKGMIHALGISKGGSKGEGDRLTRFTHQDRLKSFIPNEVLGVIADPIRFRTTLGSLAYGYEAEALAKICFAVLDAAKSGMILKQQEHIVRQCEILVRGFAIVGINALVDEATGYQEVRDRNSLGRILDKYLRKEWAAWAKCFPDEFYQEMFRLRGWQWRGMSVNRPQIVGRYTNDIVYERLAPAVLEELRKLNPLNEKGCRKYKYHQRLTEDVGHPALAQHLHAVIALMRASAFWDGFMRLLNRSLPRLNDTREMILDDEV